MDALKTYLKSLPNDGEREKFARRCLTTLNHLQMCAYSLSAACRKEPNGNAGSPARRRTVAPAVARQAEIASRRKVMRWHLRPHDWHLIWPELTKHPAAPPVPSAEQAAG